MIGVLVAAVVLSGSAELPGADSVAAQEAFQQALFERVAPAVAFIATRQAFGSGLLVSSDGLILTNAHVVKGQDVVDVVLHDGRKFRGKVIERGADEIDVALVQVEARGTPTLPLASKSDLRVGNWVAAVGHGRGGIWTFNVGMVSNIYPDGHERPVFQTQIPLNPGNSGGPIVDRHGRVVGIVTAGIEGANSINFGIDIDVARKALTRLDGQCECLVITAPAQVPVFVDGRMVGQGPRVIVAVSPGKHDVFGVVAGKMIRHAIEYPAVRAVSLELQAGAPNP